MDAYNTISAPKTQGLLWKRKQKDCKNQEQVIFYETVSLRDIRSYINKVSSM